ncbi:MAG: ankyrin repeat domain-containing protein [Candidatus Midichloria sp.]|nr:ankyrin repeat domain-containing protein [Candidatus Midichloria sp.]
MENIYQYKNYHRQSFLSFVCITLYSDQARTLITECLNNGLNINEQDKKGSTPLAFAVASGDLMKVSLLLKNSNLNPI